MKIRVIIIVFLAVLLKQAMALGPHEVLILANDRSANSIEIAKEYARLRGIPEVNIVRLGFSAELTAKFPSISPDEFSKFIWNPVMQAMKARGIDDHILAWVYSTDFPTAIVFDPVISIQGLTFLRNRLPEKDKVYRGTYLSPLFAGPDNQGSDGFSSQTFDVHREWLGEDMPLPSMMLGYTGEMGNTKEDVLKCLGRGAGSDGTAPAGTVYFVTNGDVRSSCRAWQFPRAVSELQRHGVNSVITNEFPAGAKIIGLMTGSAWVSPEAGANTYLAGAMAEHLTSAAGVFNSGDQTKLTAWIQAGATASAGTVTEPLSIWNKFPCARFYVHYAAGCTMIESFFQSIRCPLQILLVGDPLARPWGRKGEVILDGLDSEAVAGMIKVTADVKCSDESSYRNFMFLLDGKVVGHDMILHLNTAELPEGAHMLRAVAYKTGFARNQLFVEKKIIVKR